MNDRHPAGEYFPADPGADYSYAAYPAVDYGQSAYGSYGAVDYATAPAQNGWSTGAYDSANAAQYGDGDPLFGSVPGGWDPNAGAYPAESYGAYGYDAGAYANSGYDNGAYDQGAYGTGGWDTGGWDTTNWDTGGAAYQNDGFIPHQTGPDQAEQGYIPPADPNAPWDANPQWDMNAQWEASSYGTTGWDGSAYGGQADYDNAVPEHGPYEAPGPYEATVYETGTYDPYGTQDVHEAPEVPDVYEAYETYDAPDADTADPYGPDPYDPDAYALDAYGEPAVALDSEAEPEPGAAAPSAQNGGRRRSAKPRRSALLTVAAPSVAVLGVAGISAASVIPADDEDTTTQAAPDTTEVKVSTANTKLDTQLAGLREAGDDFADRASRTQERIDLKKRQEAERRRAAAEAARREALRPKFALPVQGAGISAYFGQAGINWMSVHTGLDFPVSYGTPVKAATDGTVRTQWNPAYGNMMIVTAADGTETWYCHLSSSRITSGSVKAGDVIGYSGNSGNSTGPHLHFEVHPGGGSAIDPLAWFRSHGLEPT